MDADILSCSSQTKQHPAINILSQDPSKLWLTATALGPKTHAEVVILPESPIQVTDIGTAIVEVLVGNDGVKPEKEEVLLPATALRSFRESLNGENLYSRYDDPNLRYYFSSKKLDSKVGVKDWGRVRIVISNPFPQANPEPFGLSYVRFNTGNKELEQGKHSLGHAEFEPVPDFKPKKGPVQQLLNFPKSPKKSSDFPKKPPESQKPKAAPLRMPTTLPLDIPDDEFDADPAPVAPTMPKSILKKKSTPSGSTVLAGVVATLSGFQGAQRTNLHKTLKALGGVYLESWEDSCTHVISAFPNTPKVAQARAAGAYVVSPAWLTDAAKTHSHPSEEKYALPSQDSQPHSQPHLSRQPSDKGYKSGSDDDDDGHPNEYNLNDSFIDNRGFSDLEVDDDEADQLAIREGRRFAGGTKPKRKAALAGEQKIKRMKMEPEPDEVGVAIVDRKRAPAKAQAANQSSGTGQKGSKSEADAIPEFLDGLSAYVSTNLPEADRKLLKRYIAAYGGDVTDGVNASTSVLIANEAEEQEGDYPHLHQVSPRWVLDCHKQKTMLPMDNYFL